MLPFIRTYLCEMNNSCYSYPVNNNYDEDTLKRFQNISVNITNVVGNALENENFLKLFSSANGALKLIFDARTSSTTLTSIIMDHQTKPRGTLQFLYFRKHVTVRFDIRSPKIQ
jgi:hypothetical protein